MAYKLVVGWTETRTPESFFYTGVLPFEAKTDDEALKKSEMAARRVLNRKGRRFFSLNLFWKGRRRGKLQRRDINAQAVQDRLKSFRPRGKPFVGNYIGDD